MSFPLHRPRRLRKSEVVRNWVAESRLTRHALIQPIFVREGEGLEIPIESMPGQSQLSPDRAADLAKALTEQGVTSVLLFGIPDKKDARGTESTNPRGVVATAIRKIKTAVPSLTVIADICLCEFTDHGHCGVLTAPDASGQMGIDNDATIELLGKQAVILADAGCDMVAPSAMADGQVLAIRDGLDEHGHREMPVMAYSAKYASAFYAPFRDAAENPPAFGDRRSYQMDPRNSQEAMREVALDIEEGADIVMVKPAVPYLDIVTRVKETFDVPVAAYHVSGEFSMLEAAGERKWLDRDAAMLETLTCIHRAGADVIITYAAGDVASKL